MIYPAFYISVYILTFISVIVNTFLIYCALRVKHRKKDVYLIIGVATLEYLTAVLVYIELITYLTIGRSYLKDVIGCQILGFFCIILYYFEIILNIMLAVERYFFVTQKKVHKHFFVPLHVNTLFVVASLLYICSQNMLIPSPSELVCLAPVHTNAFSAFFFFYTILGFTSGSGIIIYCYYKLAININNISEFAEYNLDNQIEPIGGIKRKQNYTKVTYKLYAIIFIYGLLMLGSGTIYTVEAIFSYYLPFSDPRMISMNMAAQLLFVIAISANSTILLFLHTGINREAHEFIRKLNIFH